MTGSFMQTQRSRSPGFTRVFLTCRVLLGNGASVEHRSILRDGPHLIGSPNGDGLEGLVCAHVQPGAALEDQRLLLHTACRPWRAESGARPHRGVLGTHSQPTQHIPLLADGPDGDLLHLALGQTRHQRDVTQTEGRHLQPRASQRDLTLPACRTEDLLRSAPDKESSGPRVHSPRPSSASDKVLHGFVSVERAVGEKNVTLVSDCVDFDGCR